MTNKSNCKPVLLSIDMLCFIGTQAQTGYMFQAPLKDVGRKHAMAMKISKSEARAIKVKRLSFIGQRRSG